MRTEVEIVAEYQKVCEAIEDELSKSTSRRPLPEREHIYMELEIVKRTLEWTEPQLIKTTTDRVTELAGCRHYVFGPTHSVLFP